MIQEWWEGLTDFLYEKKNLLLFVIAGVFLLFYFVPMEDPRVADSLHEAFAFLQDYMREYLLFSIVPAFLLAGVIMEFVEQQMVLKYLGPKTPKPISYMVGAVSGLVLAVCSCTVQPLFRGIYRKGSGIGPASAFLFSGPAIHIIGLILTVRVLGLRIGIARAAGAVVLAIILGVLMQLMFLKSDRQRKTDADLFEYDIEKGCGVSRTLGLILALMGMLVLLNLSGSHIARGGVVLFLVLLVWVLKRCFKKRELYSWLGATRDFLVQMLPLLFAGVMLSGFLFGRPGELGLVPHEWIVQGLGGNSWSSNAAGSLLGALVYFATLTEVPILHGLIGAGMGEGPALAMLLAGPSLNPPSLILIGGEMGIKKMVVYVALVLALSTIAGYLYGMLM